MTSLRPTLAKLATGALLSRDEAREAFEIIMSGDADNAQIAAFLMALRVRGEQVDEIVAGAEVMRSKADQIKVPEGAVDTCGTGGTGIDTYNVSTAAAFVTVAAGIPVAKHGNRAASSKSGSADVLEALGAVLELDMKDVQASIDEIGFTFLFARSHHKAMRHVAPVRGALQLQTIFNFLGPLSSPALAKRQIMGVFDRKWMRPLAEVLKALGSKHVWIVRGEDGMDELTTTGKTHIVELRDGSITEFDISPEDAGLDRSSLEDIKGGDADYNAAAILGLMRGEKGAFRDIVLLNAGAAIHIAGKAVDLKEGIAIAAEQIDGGKAEKIMQRWIRFTQKAHEKSLKGGDSSA
jgi:anthranilate phosphoribosyltransferase